jgi:phosphatidylglycerol---prolipoprotein diacylglyceryl transferase
MNPILIQIGPLQVHWYGVLIMLGVLVAAWLATQQAQWRGEDPEHVWNLLTWVLIFGIIGARLYHVFSTPDGYIGWAYYRQHPLAIIAFWDGGFRGLGIFGAVIGGVIAVAIYTWRHHLSPLRWLGFIAPGLLVAQAIGRMGNRVNQELYGPPTNLPWAFHINPTYSCQEPAGSPMACGIPDRLTASARDWYATHGFQPDFFYEAGWNLIGFAIIWTLSRRLSGWLRDGDLFFMYLIWYPLGRFWVEALRPDAWRIGLLATAQWFSLAGIAIGVAGLIINHHRARPTATTSAEEPAPSAEAIAGSRAE